MIVFLDTEFTDLVLRPRLLSLGLVEGGGLQREFYAEVTDRQHLLAVSRFAHDAVVPQLGRVGNAACPYRELGLRLCNWFEDLVATLMRGEVVHVAFGYYLDWDLLELAVHDAGDARWDALRPHLLPLNIFDLTGHGDARLAAERYLESQVDAPLSRHHALCDARALQRAFLAATSEPDGRVRVAEMLALPTGGDTQGGAAIEASGTGRC